MARWGAEGIPDQSGRMGLVTGATDGIGYETALALAAHGMRVLLAGRNPQKGERALERIRQAHPGAEVSFELVELGDLDSVGALAGRLSGRPLDLLVNNAGIMALPERRTTAEGFEQQLGVNFLSHFALTGLLLANLQAGSAARVVSLSSLAHRAGTIAFDDLQQTHYAPFRAYAQSKLAMLMFAKELQRRSDKGGWGLLSLGAHPGVSSTNLGASMRRMPDGPVSPAERMLNLASPIISQSAAAGALPTLFAATAPQVVAGGYYGPDGFMEMKGAPAPAKVSAAAGDAAAAARLWSVAQALTGEPFKDAA